MALNETQQKRSRARFARLLDSVEPSRLAQTTKAGEQKLNRFNKQPPASLAGGWQE